MINRLSGAQQTANDSVDPEAQTANGVVEGSRQLHNQHRIKLKHMSIRIINQQVLEEKHFESERGRSSKFWHIALFLLSDEKEKNRRKA